MGRTLQPEDNIAHYRVIGPLGAGGMGEVYLAHDTTLERDVALKVLPAELVRSEDRVMRFVMEAKSASSLSHPHIVTIYEIGRQKVRSPGDEEPVGDEVHYIAMELVNGKTVGDLIHKEKTDLKTMLRHLAQAAEGLSKAHAAGIVHRDLKPGNIMVTNDGYAKVLDFGLAKLTEKRTTDADMTSAPTEVERTTAGAVVGTVGYMSPEQVKGKSVDNRSDIFSFGCILYEAATCTRPFAAESTIDTMHKIVHDNPTPVDELSSEAPAELRRLIKRCLAKNADQRLQSIKDLAIELREIVDEFDSLSATATSASSITQPLMTARRSPLLTAGIVAVVGLGAAGIAFGLWSMLGSGEAETSAGRPFQSTRMRSLMSDSNVFGATLSTDGRYLAYIKGPSGQWSLWVRQVATGSDVEILAPQPMPIRGVNFSLDGNYLYYLGSDPDTPAYSALFEVPSLGGAPRKRIFDIDTAVSFAPDGKRAAFMRGIPDPPGDHLMIVDLESDRERVLAVAERPDQIHLTKPAWSPDGSRIVTVWHAATEQGVRHSLVAFDADNGERETLSDPVQPTFSSFAWLPDGRGIIATTAPATGQSFQVLLYPYPQGQRRQITSDLDTYSEVSVTSDGSSIAALRTSRDSNLWRASAEGGDFEPITSRSTTEGIRNLRPQDDGSLVFTALKDRYAHLWTMNPDGTGRRQITSQAGWAWGLRPLPDHRGVVFNLFGEAETRVHVWRVDLDGGNLKQVTRGEGEGMVSLSPDGRTILFTKTLVPRDLWRLSLEGVEPEKLLDSYRFGAAFSPDGRFVLYADSEEIEGRQHTVWRVIPSEGGQPVAVIKPPGGGSDFEWVPDSSGLTYVLTADDGVQNIWFHPVGGGEPVQVTRFNKGRIHNVEHSPGGDLIAVERALDGNENVWTVDAAGGDLQQITEFRDDLVFDMEWARDGSSLFITQGDVRREVVMITDSPTPFH